MPLSVEHIRYYAGWADKIHGSIVPVGPASGPMMATVYKEPLGGGSDHPLELPHPHGCMEAWTCSSCRQLRRHEGKHACLVSRTASCSRDFGVTCWADLRHEVKVACL